MILDEGEDFRALDPRDSAFLPQSSPPGLEMDERDAFEAEHQAELAGARAGRSCTPVKLGKDGSDPFG